MKTISIHGSLESDCFYSSFQHVIESLPIQGTLSSEKEVWHHWTNQTISEFYREYVHLITYTYSSSKYTILSGPIFSFSSHGVDVSSIKGAL